MYQCRAEGLKCKEKITKECEEKDELVTSDKLWRECVQKNPDCGKIIEYCGKCGLELKEIPYPHY